jgi:hypothetical protein
LKREIITQLFKLNIEGEARKILGGKGKTVTDLLDEESVYLIIDGDRKTIWLYKGLYSDPILQFKSFEIQKKMKLKLAGFYSTRNFDFLKKDDKLYKEIMDSKVKEGRAEEILKDTEKNVESADYNSLNKTLQEQSRARETCVHKGIVVKDVLRDIEELENPPNYHRHMTLIGAGVYILNQEIEKFLPDLKKRKELKKIGTLPNGFFFLENSSTRLVIKKGKIQCIDLMVSDDNFLGTNKLMVPILYKKEFNNKIDQDIFMNAFKELEPGVDDNTKTEEPE